MADQVLETNAQKEVPAEEITASNEAMEVAEQDEAIKTKEEEEEEEEEEWVEDLTHLEDFDLYKALHLTKQTTNQDRARACYHRLSYRYHPQYGRQGDQTAFCKLTLAYLVLKDDERRHIYNEHGMEGIRKSEEYMDPSVFEINPYEFYEDFYAGKDPDDKQYFLLNGADVHVSDSEEEDEDEGMEENEADDIEVDDEVVVPELSEEEKAKLLEKAKALESVSMPMPPPVVMVSSLALPGGPGALPPTGDSTGSGLPQRPPGV